MISSCDWPGALFGLARRRPEIMDRLDTNVLPAPMNDVLVNCHCRTMQLLNEMANEIARTDIPVLIVGESGTGKDAYARLIHQLSFRSSLRFNKCNCGSYDSDQLRTQIHQSGEKHTGADSWGTLYLDNVQELDSSAQRILLSLLPDGEDADSRVSHIGRLISSATPTLETEVELNHFRRELYYRLAGACVRIPPLRERREDIPQLIEYFLKKYSVALKRNSPQLDDRMVQTLASHHWPGNIRELENFARTAVLFGDFETALNQLRHVDREPTRPGQEGRLCSLKLAAKAASKKAERELILRALEQTHWNRKRAARDLQISYKSLLYKIKEIGVSEGERGS